MDSEAALKFLGIDPSRLTSAPRADRSRAARDRVHGAPRTCVRCGGPATATSIADTPTDGPRWIDLCTPDYVATVKAQRSGTEATLEEIMDVMADAAGEAGFSVTVITDTVEVLVGE